MTTPTTMAAFVARAGAAVVQRLANAQAEVMGHRFDVHQRQQPAMVDLGGGLVQSRSVIVDALRADVDAAPVAVCEGACITVDGTAWVVVQRTDRPLLGQVSLHLEPAP